MSQQSTCTHWHQARRRSSSWRSDNCKKFLRSLWNQQTGCWPRKAPCPTTGYQELPDPNRQPSVKIQKITCSATVQPPEIGHFTSKPVGAPAESTSSWLPTTRWVRVTLGGSWFFVHFVDSVSPVSASASNLS